MVAAAAKLRGCCALQPWSLRASCDFEANRKNRQRLAIFFSGRLSRLAATVVIAILRCDFCAAKLQPLVLLQKCCDTNWQHKLQECCIRMEGTLSQAKIYPVAELDSGSAPKSRPPVHDFIQYGAGVCQPHIRNIPAPTKIKLALPPPPKKPKSHPPNEEFYGHGGFLLQKEPTNPRRP